MKLKKYNKELLKLQIELLKLQNYVKKEKLKILIIFEGRDTAGKGGTIKRFRENLNPRGARVVALDKPTEQEKGQLYFQRYIKELPNEGEIVFFDRSWYNRGAVEPVMGFCTEEENRIFLEQVPEFEKILVDSNIILLKFYFSIKKETQEKRLNDRKIDPLKQYKISSIDDKAQEYWYKYSKEYKKTFLKTHNEISPWNIIISDDKKKARLNAIKLLLNKINYENKIEYFKIDKEIIINVNKEIEKINKELENNI